MAKSLNQNFQYCLDNESQLEEDEQLARAIQESLNVDSPPRYGNEYGNGNGYGNGFGNGNGYGYGNGHGNGNGNHNIYQPIPMYYPMGYRYMIL